MTDAATLIQRVRAQGATVTPAGHHAVSVSAPAHVPLDPGLVQQIAERGSECAQALRAEQREAIPEPAATTAPKRRRYFA